MKNKIKIVKEINLNQTKNLITEVGHSYHFFKRELPRLKMFKSEAVSLATMFLY